MTINKTLKIFSFVLVVCMILNLPCPVLAGNYFVSSSGSENSQEVTVGYKFKFGNQENTNEHNDKIEKLKQEDTKGAGTAIGLIILGACIVAAAVLIVNAANDITDEASDKTDELVEEVKNEYEEVKQEQEEQQQQEEQPPQVEEPAPEPAPEAEPEPAPEGE